MRNTINVFASLLIASAFAFMPAHAQFSPGSGGGGTFTGPFPGNPIDPTIMFGAQKPGSTTGTIASGSNSLTVLSATGWSVGDGITVGNVGATVRENGCVGTITGLVFTIVACGTSTPVNAGAPLTGHFVYHDDTYALNQASALANSTGRPIELQAGTFLVTSPWIITTPSQYASIMVRGAGVLGGTTVSNLGLTNDTIQATGVVSLSDFMIYQFGTPTSGYGLNIVGGACPSAQLFNLSIERVNIWNTFNGLFFGAGISASHVFNMNIQNGGGPYGVYYNTATPCGGNTFYNVSLNSQVLNQGDFAIYAADVLWLQNLNFEIAVRLYIIHESDRVLMTSPSLEAIGAAVQPSCGIDFASSSTVQFTITGGEIAGYGNAFCNTDANLGGSASNVIGYQNGSGGSGFNDGGNGILNYQWPKPVVSGCTGTVTGDALQGTIAATCTAQSLTLTMNTGNQQVPQHGQLCTVTDVTTPATLFRQSSWAIQTTGPYFSSATFAATTTGAGDTLTYKCAPF